ncbi:DUF1571 domain-containing protein [Aureliella helgolandensis]|uniref:DUF1571 domain-containing protein n=1 Tax=Aureliella helgolandensis TaxID=2527968 RepID=A0A518GAJ9_9BACT|nr:DUF1571 domain-containing protein [Aureliella helgolandensis]QDV25622.1 hypothetical protein Q31a_39480 [Aureliella helgolandensis]
MTRFTVSFAMVGLLIVAISLVGFWSQFAVDSQHSSLEGMISTQTPVVTHRPASDGTQISDNAHPLDQVLELASEVLKSMQANVQDYRATLVKRERIGGRLGEEAKLLVKVRSPQTTGTSPRGLAAYLKFIEPSSTAGREVIWAADQREGELVSHEGGFLNLKRLQLKPDGMLAMLGNKYPITEIGLQRLVEKLIEKGREDRTKGPCQVDIIEDQKVGDRVCRLIQVVHPTPDAGFDFHIAQIFIDIERQIPLRYAAFLWPKQAGGEPPLEEEYTYLDVELNIGLSDADFDPDNPLYNFP